MSDDRWLRDLLDKAAKEAKDEGDYLMAVAHPLASGIDYVIEEFEARLRKFGLDEGMADSVHLEVVISLLIHQLRQMLKKGSNDAISEDQSRKIGVVFRDKLQDLITSVFLDHLQNYKFASFDKGGLEMEKPGSPVERRRLEDGAKAMALPEPKTTAEAREQIEVIADGIRALQSLDDLGKETNKKVMDDMAVLQKKYDRLNRKLKS